MTSNVDSAPSRKTNQRKELIPLGGHRDVLVAKNRDDDYIYRVMNDKDGRLLDAQAAGYEVVSDPNTYITGQRIDDSSKDGSVVSKYVGDGIHGVLMRIPKEIYEEQQAMKQARVDENTKALYGDLTDPARGRHGVVTVGGIKQ